MLATMPYKTKQFFVVLIKLSIVCGAIYFILLRLSEHDGIEFNQFFSELKQSKFISAWHLLILLALSSSNWLFEILKWQSLTKPVKTITLQDALKQSLAGLTASLVTPNRIGDYGAKVLYYPPIQRKQIGLLNLLGHMGQMTGTTLFGLAGILVFTSQYPKAFGLNINILGIYLVLLIIGIGIVIFMLKRDISIKGFSLKRLLDYILALPSSVHYKNLGYSTLRYLIFSFQFYYILQLFHVNLSYVDGMVIITSMYLLASVIPTLMFFDVVVKSSIALFLFSFTEVNQLSVLSTCTIMWVLNFAVPSLVGSYFILNFKVPRTKL